MPQPTSPASVRIVQYCPFCQRLLMPMAQPLLNWSGRAIVRGSGSFMLRLLLLPRSDETSQNNKECRKRGKKALPVFPLHDEDDATPKWMDNVIRRKSRNRRHAVILLFVNHLGDPQDVAVQRK